MSGKLISWLLVLIIFFVKDMVLISEEFDYDRHEIKQGTFKYSFKSPGDWQYYTKEENDEGLYVILRPESYGWDSTFQLNFFPYSFENENSDFPIMYIFSKSKSKYKNFTMSNFLNSLNIAYDKELVELPDNPFDTDIKINDEVIFKHYFGFNNIFYVSFAYIDEEDNILTFALITRNKAEHKNCYSSFGSLINSYQFLTNQANEDSEDIDSFGKIDLENIERKKEEEDKSYMNDMSSLDYLEVAYRNKSKHMLENFFDAWVINSKPITEEEFNLKTDLEKEIYRIFKIFYNPKKLSKYSAPSWGHGEYQDEKDEIYNNAKYIIMQNSITVVLYDTTKFIPRNYYRFRVNQNDTTFIRDISVLQIMDFVPNIQFEGAKVIQGNNYFLKIINQFLGTDYSEGSIHELPMVKGESERRLKFLNNYVQIIPGHWGGYYHIESFPLILNIRMNLDMTVAEVFFKNVYAWYGASLEKREGNWEILSSGLMFVE